MNATVATVEWRGGPDGYACVLDQTLLPGEIRVLEVRTIEAMWDAIRRLAVRGAPAIGVAAAFGAVLGAQRSKAEAAADFRRDLEAALGYLATARPTAVNLFWALDEMRAAVARAPDAAGAAELRDVLFRRAKELLQHDRDVCRRIGERGATLVSDGDRLLTHCNAGALATAGTGTALAVMYAAWNQGKRFAVIADETRPLLQGARLTSWELSQAGIPVTLICDNAAAQVMREGRVRKVFVGADRIARNGDVANKIGTYGVAVLAKEHGVPFYVVAPLSTFDLTLASGEQIPIEERAPEEVTQGFGCRTAPSGVSVYNPAFDVTPAELVTAIVTEAGIVDRPNRERIEALFRGADRRVSPLHGSGDSPDLHATRRQEKR